MVYASEEGLDMRFSRKGMYGHGIYFADNANYVKRYAYKVNPASNIYQNLLGNN
jgi:hypothetical protein